MALSRTRSRQLAQLVAGARAGLGVLALAAPNVALRPWIGERDGDRGALLLARALGARDLALGLGGLLAARHQAPMRGWVEAGGLADAGDTVVTLLALGHLPRGGRWMVLAAAGGAAVIAGLVAGAVDGPEEPPGHVDLTAGT